MSILRQLQLPRWSRNLLRQPAHVTVSLTGSHLPALDAIRGLAILLVTLYRFRLGPDDGMWFEHVYTHVLSLGERGVDLFFVLSGFLITGILFDSKSDRHYFRNFYMRRSLRIFPLYYGVLLGCFVILPIVWPANIQYPFADAREVQNWLWLYGVNMRVGWHNDWCFGSFNHFWSLAVEEHFYLIWPLAIFVLSRRSAMNVCVVFGIFALVARIAWLVLGGNGLAPEVFTPFQFDALLIGAWLALAARGPGGLAALVPACRLAFPLCLGLLLPEMVLHQRWLTVPSTIYAIMFGSLIILALSAKQGGLAERCWNSRCLRWLGKYSYGMYVFQNLLIPVLAMLFTAESLAAVCGSAFAGRLLYLAVMFAATMVTAYVSWHLYEKHFLKLKCFFSPTSSAGGLAARKEDQAQSNLPESCMQSTTPIRSTPQP